MAPDSLAPIRPAGPLPAPALPALDQEFSVAFRYPVRFSRGLLDPGSGLLAEVVTGDPQRPLLFVVDAGVAEHRPGLSEEIRAYCAAWELPLAAAPLVVPGGEAAKNDPRIVDRVRAAIDAGGVCRHSYVVAIGGGAVLDMAGFAAATAHRGVRLVRLPTTVLAQNDSAVGVKNGVNAFGKKNWLGSFAPPHAVLCDADFLTTLSDRDWRAGMSEAVKVALIKDADFFAWLERSAGALRRRDPAPMERLIHRCAELHLEHIATSGDPFELGSSRPLDFGHWAAHKLEQLSGYGLRHGEAVSVGIALDVTYAWLTGMLGKEDRDRSVRLLSDLGLPVHVPELGLQGECRPVFLDGRDEFREHLGGRLTVMLLERIGRGVEVHELDEATLIQASRLLASHPKEASDVPARRHLRAHAA